jgi:hypothetical protein
MQPKVLVFPIAQERGCQGQVLGAGKDDHERLQDLIERLDAVVPRLEKLAEKLQWEVSGMIWSKGE